MIGFRCLARHTLVAVYGFLVFSVDGNDDVPVVGREGLAQRFINRRRQHLFDKVLLIDGHAGDGDDFL